MITPARKKDTIDNLNLLIYYLSSVVCYYLIRNNLFRKLIFTFLEIKWRKEFKMLYISSASSVWGHFQAFCSQSVPYWRIQIDLRKTFLIWKVLGFSVAQSSNPPSWAKGVETWDGSKRPWLYASKSSLNKCCLLFLRPDGEKSNCSVWWHANLFNFHQVYEGLTCLFRLKLYTSR